MLTALTILALATAGAIALPGRPMWRPRNAD